MNPRRTFIFNCTAAVTALALAPLWATRTSAGTSGTFRSIDDLNYPALAAQVNTQFRVHTTSGKTVHLILLKAPVAHTITALPGRRPPVDAGNEKFSLIFSGPRDQIIEPAIHQFEHEKLGRFEMYIGQIGTRDPDTVRYEIVFNRPPTSAGRTI